MCILIDIVKAILPRKRMEQVPCTILVHAMKLMRIDSLYPKSVPLILRR